MMTKIQNSNLRNLRLNLFPKTQFSKFYRRAVSVLWKMNKGNYEIVFRKQIMYFYFSSFFFLFFMFISNIYIYIFNTIYFSYPLWVVILAPSTSGFPPETWRLMVPRNFLVVSKYYSWPTVYGYIRFQF